MPIEHLPPRFKPVAYRLRAALMSDAAAMLIVGVMAQAKGFTYLARPAFYHPAESWFELHTWAIIWIIVGSASMFSTMIPRTWFALLAFGTIVGMNVLWGLSYAWGSIVSDMNLWASAINHWGISTLVVWAVWRGSRRHIRFDGGRQ